MAPANQRDVRHDKRYATLDIQWTYCYSEKAICLLDIAHRVSRRVSRWSAGHYYLWKEV